MSSLDRCRRAATVLLVATFLVLVPQLATATFTATQDVSQSVGTATMGTPTGVIGTWQCWATGNGNNGNDNGNGNNGNGNGNGNAYAYGHGYNHGNDHDEGWEAVQVSVVSFSDAEPTGVTYRYSLERDGRSLIPPFTSAARNAWLVNGSLDDNAPTTWTLTIQSSYGNWTGPAYTRSISCPQNKGDSGSL